MTVAYIVDENLRIVYANEEVWNLKPDLQYGEYCYRIFCDGSSQCINCPLRQGNPGKAVVLSRLHGEYVRISSAEISYPGTEKSHIILMNTISDKEETSFYNNIYQSDYNELLELNYAENTYNVLFHSGKKLTGTIMTGEINSMVRYVAERVIHPDDRQRFYEFWALDQIGKEVAPKELLMPQKSKFRRLLEDGSYELAEQVFIPTRQGSEGELYLMSFFNSLGNIGKGDPQAAGVYKQLVNGGIFDKPHFFEAVEKVVHAEGSHVKFCLLSIDIENLKLFNEWYGRNEGNRLIAGVAHCLQSMSDLEYSILGYFGNDDFGLLMPYNESKIEHLNHALHALLETYSNKIGFLPAIGVYEISDCREAVATMYDRAELARSSIKGNYSVRVKKFNQKMLEELTSKYILLSDVKRALREKEFIFFLQPKCNIENGKIVGAEALVRWKNRNGEMISPGIFIPFLETSGFIAELDTYIWEEVCKWQRSILDRGFNTIPVSVNVSRVDIYSMDIPTVFQTLIKTYELDPKLIQIEITESTYTENNNHINSVVTELRKAGFYVLMDDFGSGYSSLNMLKDVEVDVLKIDMKFLSIDESNERKGVGILQTIHNMARLMGTEIIVEGVETEKQIKFLQKMDCNYAQGYYFYRPMAVSDFESIMKNPDKLDYKEYKQRRTKQIYLRDLLSEDMFSEIMLNNMLGAVAFYDVSEEGIVIRRYNDLYVEEVGNPIAVGEKLNLRNYLFEEDIPVIMQMFKEARENQYEGSVGEMRRIREDGAVVWLLLRTFFLKEQDGHAIYYSSIRNVSEIHQKNEELKEQNLALRFLNNDMPGGYFRYAYNDDADIMFVSPRFLDMLGFTRTELKQRFQDKYINIIHPEDRNVFLRSKEALAKNGGDYSLTYRVQQKSGYIAVTEQSRFMEYEGRRFFQGIILHDLHQSQFVAEMGRYEENQPVLDCVPCGILQVEADGERRLRYVSNSLLSMLGYTREEFFEKYKSTLKLDRLEERVRQDAEILNQLQHSSCISVEHCIELVDGSKKWIYCRGRLVVDHDGNRLFNVVIIDHDYLKEKYREQEWKHLKYKSLAEIPGMLVYDYDPALDQMTLEIAQFDGSLKIIVEDKFMETYAQQTWLSREKAAEQKSALLAATKQVMNGTTEFKARLYEDGEFRWYRSYFQSLADEYGNIYRVVGRADCIDAENVR